MKRGRGLPEESGFDAFEKHTGADRGDADQQSREHGWFKAFHFLSDQMRLRSAAKLVI